MHFVHLNKNYSSSEEALKNQDGLLVLGTFIKVSVLVYSTLLFASIFNNNRTDDIIRSTNSGRYVPTNHLSLFLTMMQLW